AAAELNRAGLRLGAIENTLWTPESQQPVNSVTAQSVSAGENVSPGTSIGITVLRNPNVTLIYDDNELTLINSSNGPLDLNTIIFSAGDGSKRLSGGEWQRFLDQAILDAGDCAQVWSIRAGQAKQVPGCDSIYWLTTNDETKHFWTQVAGAESFNVLSGSDSLAMCPAAPPNSQDNPTTCSFFVNTTTDSNVTPYLYFAYTTEAFGVINVTSDRWMSLSSTPLYRVDGQQGASVEFRLSDPTLFGGLNTIADTRRLAPQQCFLLITLNDSSPPEPCEVMGQVAVEQSTAFWTAPFEISPVSQITDRVTCPAAVADQVMICVVPA
ncbi:MAG: PASTA domain-containing protein, partial [Chloroflexota bacterium]